MRELNMTARIESSNPRHATIGVFQNGGKAGVLCVDVEHAEAIIEILKTGNAIVRCQCPHCGYRGGMVRYDLPTDPELRQA